MRIALIMTVLLSLALPALAQQSQQQMPTMPPPSEPQYVANISGGFGFTLGSTYGAAPAPGSPASRSAEFVHLEGVPAPKPASHLRDYSLMLDPTNRQIIRIFGTTHMPDRDTCMRTFNEIRTILENKYGPGMVNGQNTHNLQFVIDRGPRMVGMSCLDLGQELRLVVGYVDKYAQRAFEMRSGQMSQFDSSPAKPTPVGIGWASLWTKE